MRESKAIETSILLASRVEERERGPGKVEVKANVVLPTTDIRGDDDKGVSDIVQNE